jgi:hypothetical protein
VVTVKLTQDIESEGLVTGDVINVDKFSAAAMVKRGVAEEYDADSEPEVAREAAEPATYGGKPAETIDDIHDPDAQRDRRVQTAVRVGGPDPGPPRSPNPAQVPDPAVLEADSDPEPTEHKSGTKAASGAKPRGGDAGGGDTSS